MGGLLLLGVPPADAAKVPVTVAARVIEAAALGRRDVAAFLDMTGPNPSDRGQPKEKLMSLDEYRRRAEREAVDG